MKTLKLAGKTIEVYDDIENLPVTRFHKYNKMLLVDAGIGSDIADFDKHISRIAAFLAKNDNKQAIIELENIRQNVYFIQSGVSPRNLAFAVLVKSIDGKPCDDLSDEGLKKIVDMFSDVPYKDLAASIEAVKKKIDRELQIYFPRLFDDATVKEYYDQLKRRTVLILQTIIDGGSKPEREKEIDDITAELITYFNPKSFSGSDSVEIEQDKQFEKICLMLSQYLHIDPKNMSVLAYYNAFEYIKEMSKDLKHRSKAK